MNRYELHLDISAEQYLDYYRGTARHVVARTTTGLVVQFPASLLQRFVTAEGIHGHFVLTADAQFKHAALQRVSVLA